MAERGTEGFSLLDAARACGVGASAPYKHFADRAALLRALAGRGQVMLGEALGGAWAGGEGDKRAAFARVGAAYLRFAREAPGEYAAMFTTRARKAGLEGPAAEVLDAALRAQGLGASELGMRIWALAHGAAMLERSGFMGAGDADRVVLTGVGGLLHETAGPR